jgi:hypothetical protein
MCCNNCHILAEELREVRALYAAQCRQLTQAADEYRDLADKYQVVLAELARLKGEKS